MADPLTKDGLSVSQSLPVPTVSVLETGEEAAVVLRALVEETGPDKDVRVELEPPDVLLHGETHPKLKRSRNRAVKAPVKTRKTTTRITASATPVLMG